MSSNFILNLARRSAGLAPLVPFQPSVTPVLKPDVSWEEIDATTESQIAPTEAAAVPMIRAPEPVRAPRVALPEQAPLVQAGPPQTEPSPPVELRSPGVELRMIEKTTPVLAEPSEVIPSSSEPPEVTTDFQLQVSPPTVPIPISTPQPEIATPPTLPAPVVPPTLPAPVVPPTPAASFNVLTSPPSGMIQRTAEPPPASSPPVALPAAPESQPAPAEIRVAPSVHEAQAERPSVVIKTATVATAEPAAEPAVVVQPRTPQPSTIRTVNKRHVQAASRPVQVRIGTIEVQSSAPPPAAPTSAAPATAPSSSEGFGDYIGLRTYVSWERP